MALAELLLSALEDKSLLQTPFALAETFEGVADLIEPFCSLSASEPIPKKFKLGGNTDVPNN